MAVVVMHSSAWRLATTTMLMSDRDKFLQIGFSACSTASCWASFCYKAGVGMASLSGDVTYYGLFGCDGLHGRESYMFALSSLSLESELIVYRTCDRLFGTNVGFARLYVDNFVGDLVSR